MGIPDCKLLYSKLGNVLKGIYITHPETKKLCFKYRIPFRAAVYDTFKVVVIYQDLK